MSRVLELLCSRRAPQVAALALMSVGFSGCSADMQTRLSQDPFAREATGAVPQQAPRELPQYSRPQYQQQQPQYQSQPLPPPIAAPQSYPSAAAPQAYPSAQPRGYPSANAGVSGGGRGVASYAPPSAAAEITGSTAPRSVAAKPAARGTTIIVGTSDSLETLARRYNVSTAEILQANGYRGPRALSPGQSLIIPTRAAAALAPPAAAPAMTAPATRPAMVAAAAPASVHVVNPGDSLMSIARRNRVPVAELARANGLAPNAPLKIGTKLTVPSGRSAEAATTPAPAAAPVAVAAAPAPAPAAAPIKMAAALPAEPAQKVRLASATTTPAETAAPEAPVKAAEATGALPTFRWPVRGRVITSYGAKTNGKQNDGINVAVPEGTPIKAAEDGVVAYSGSELKGYGNLVLVRHSNGYVTAYAHASELMVKRGETIKRGQTIAKSGQSGEVASPQLHFEIRKGSSPVDPLQFLNGA
ncbi:peptidoglycan DD-metalloendopeptidase family protein [Rhodopseudomonas rhenobacensis]|nr:peptidoglycan DD-metalloendopeptidase family protein [Rhodopseudomonas rhenobacensis]